MKKETKIDKERLPASNTPLKCPDCGGKMYRGKIPCPDGDENCKITHYGVTCLECGKSFK